MTKPNPSRIADLLDRLCRAQALGARSDDLNPAQQAALAYLDRANRFSRAPSHVADYLCTTRGTASQTLKALMAKGFIRIEEGAGDRRSKTYSVTDTGRDALRMTGATGDAIDRAAAEHVAVIEEFLSTVLTEQLRAGGFRSFGLCRTCRHHQERETGRFCGLLNVTLDQHEAELLCHEHAA